MRTHKRISSEQVQWTFYRIGGLDQVTLRSTEELRHLKKLDPKLWIVLSCPIRGLQFNQRTLELMDSDKDERIRIPDVLHAVNWLVQRLKDPVTMTEGRNGIPLEFIRDDTQEGKLLLASAKRLLLELGKPHVPALGEEDVAGVRATTVQTLLNGDGVIPPHESLDSDLKEFINNILDTVGTSQRADGNVTRGVKDVDGSNGINRDMLRSFMDQAREYHGWLAQESKIKHESKLGDKTGIAYGIFRRLADKIDDYFIRCHLVQFDNRAAAAVNAPESILESLGAHPLVQYDEAMAGLPLAKVAAGTPLPLDKGLNPAWIDKMREFKAEVLIPLLGDKPDMSEEEWDTIKAEFAGYAALLDERPQNLQDLEPARIETILSGDLQARLENLFDRDAEVAPEVANMEGVERLVLYHKYLYRFLMNFVSFADFYAADRDTIFQNGTLYIDGRSCELCTKVDNIENHAAAAQNSYLCLLYCKCVRQESGETMNIVAAMTAGDSEFLLIGRNGIFVDRAGAVWDASLVKLVDNPISLRTAVFAPYRRFANMISEQVEKFTANKDAALATEGSTFLQNISRPPGTSAEPAASAAPFDITKSVGVLAAVGLALGALGTALATIAASVLSLRWWEIPLLILGILILISGPSVVLAWMKLRKRSLGPVLDASGWAVNTLIPINFPLGSRLTDRAELPVNSNRQLRDPLYYANPWKRCFLAVLLLSMIFGGVFGGWWVWNAIQGEAEEAATTSAAGEASHTPDASELPAVTAPEDNPAAS